MKASNVSITVPSSTSDESEEDPYMDGAHNPDNPFAPQVYPKPGVLPSTPGCSKMSLSPTFDISDFSRSAAGGISFKLKNSGLNYTQKCNVQISQSTGQKLQAPSWWNCTRFDPLHVNYPANGIYTSILYGGPRNVLGINQTWYCNDEDVSKP